jgi:hypothetical protein
VFWAISSNVGRSFVLVHSAVDRRLNFSKVI